MKVLNDVRARATLAPVTTTAVDDFGKAVRAERYFESCFEDKMWFDMIRARKVRNDLTKSWDDFVGYSTVYTRTFTAKNLLLPILKREIDNNCERKQNAGF